MEAGGGRGVGLVLCGGLERGEKSNSDASARRQKKGGGGEMSWPFYFLAIEIALDPFFKKKKVCFSKTMPLQSKAVLVCTPLSDPTPPNVRTPEEPSSLPVVQGWGWDEWERFLSALPPFEAGLEAIPDSSPVPVPPALLMEAMEEGVAVLSSRLPPPLLDAILPPPASPVRDGTAFVAKTRKKFSQIVCVGDVHSSAGSLLRVARLMRERGVFGPSLSLANGTALVFLGDMVNRGPYSSAVLLFLLCLLFRNRKRVFMLSGNHEDPDLWNTEDAFVGMPFGEEVRRACEAQDEVEAESVLSSANRLFSLLPCALFVRSPRKGREGEGKGGGGSWIQLSHGGFDPVLAGGSYLSTGGEKRRSGEEERSFDIEWGGESAIRSFLSSSSSSSAMQLTLANSTPLASDLRVIVGDRGVPDAEKSADYHLLKWSDLSGVGEGMDLDEESGRWFFGRPATREYLRRAGVAAIVGGHQDLVPFGVFSGEKPPSSSEEMDGEYDFAVPPPTREEEGASLVDVADFLAIKTSISSDSKPGLFDRLCYLVLSPRDEAPAPSRPRAERFAALQREFDDAVSLSPSRAERESLVSAYRAAVDSLAPAGKGRGVDSEFLASSQQMARRGR